MSLRAACMGCLGGAHAALARPCGGLSPPGNPPPLQRLHRAGEGDDLQEKVSMVSMDSPPTSRSLVD